MSWDTRNSKVVHTCKNCNHKAFGVFNDNEKLWCPTAKRFVEDDLSGICKCSTMEISVPVVLNAINCRKIEDYL